MIVGIVDCEKNIAFKNIEKNLDKYQDIVGGYIELIYFPKNIICVCNEEALIRGMHLNFTWSANDIVHHIYGNCFFVSDDGEGDFCSLNEEQIGFLNEYFFDDVFE